ncbi:VOC family protein [Phenylobacterium sp.]|uniref:VOC family protein n=1 Tax=Phenylobacterium sp. TaxID=1871053 RepID=UPI0028122CED|nr:VOC family protein [Phenylobacterium sp.]
MGSASIDQAPPAGAVHSLDHFALSVPDLGLARQFYESFGLDVRVADRGLELRTFGGEHVWARIAEAPRKKLEYICFGAFAPDLPVIAARLRELDTPQLPPPDGEPDGALWFRDPAGILLQVRTAPKSSPDEKRPAVPPPPFNHERASPYRDARPDVRPIGLSHALFFQPDMRRAIEFYTAVLGLKLSDDAGPVAFLHGVHGSEHHLIAFAHNEAGPGYHHSAWAVRSIEEVGLGAAQMEDAGYARGWGLGRHVLGSNYFHYVRDPWGSYAEYSFDIDYIPRGYDWVGGHPDPENSFYLWGPNPPEDFTRNYEAEPA